MQRQLAPRRAQAAPRPGLRLAAAVAMCLALGTLLAYGGTTGAIAPQIGLARRAEKGAGATGTATGDAAAAAAAAAPGESELLVATATRVEAIEKELTALGKTLAQVSHRASFSHSWQCRRRLRGSYDSAVLPCADLHLPPLRCPHSARTLARPGAARPARGAHFGERDYAGAPASRCRRPPPHARALPTDRRPARAHLRAMAFDSHAVM